MNEIDEINNFLDRYHYKYRLYSSPKTEYSSKETRDKISAKLTNLFQPKSRMDRMITCIIKEIMDYKVVPYFADVITRYTEQEFHQKLAEGFDIIDDMRMNHPQIYNGFIKVTRKLRNRLNFDHTVLFNMIIEIVEGQPYLWQITGEERVKLYRMVLKLNSEIYS